ncbi:molybdenum cofactor biosysynthesis protein [Mycobacterium colombiense]|uniref:Molybdenum cofactor biosysynthesis protein n=1 Tax=Mycobacterium colombiense TaxID=339268 RepID=A0A853M530_9MYCO|nr:MOSC N-terminal beta barrel domain-containing protein [Mycobacterium colombiense]OBJ06926.1 molybdenum cofactor biosysynthesis protein [Mycobacterium colombiense]OBJ19878.1 molybdenum cofactor biosysynthesis protein [Mycobacterium colombiense]OBJ42434.1 molybdenum cofactor biosysynthesis protein [Mycobacterium colombiense]OBJ64543.1 molybdenum cofactor biosysynthesis protein [Mycobacterium colombiense]OBJ78000.1 molybdenum cofactor biosysynthesis protein [Mycobacterium colombiense]
MDNSTGQASDAAGMRVQALLRYPVKSMLGEALDRLLVDERGAEGDRRLALLDGETGHVASAKNPRLWRDLLTCTAHADARGVRISLPDGTDVAADDPGVDELISRLTGRRVRLVTQRPDGATLVRPDPEQLLELGLDAEVDGRILRIAAATPGESFTDEAPLHAITTATLEHIGVEALRYRPNLVIATPPDYPPYAENDWVGSEIAVGEARLRVLTATSRCVVPTLEHGPLPRAPQALRIPAAENRVNTGGHGAQPCAGAYLAVVSQGVVRVGDPVTIGP